MVEGNKLAQRSEKKSVTPAAVTAGATVDSKTAYDFKIAGVSYKIKTSHDEQTVENLVGYVNKKVSDAMKITKNASFQNAAVLAALNIAEEMILLKKRAQAELEKLELKAQKLAQDIENSKVNKTSWN